jgi:hypothetical protein
MTMGRTTERSLDDLVRALRGAGWRVRNGHWLATRAAARWDFCRTNDMLCPMTPAASRAMDQAFDGQAVTRRHLEGTAITSKGRELRVR